MAHIAANAFWTFVWKTVESYAISAITNKLFGAKSKNASPTYSFGTLQTQTNSSMVMALIYGEVKCAGNVIWADDGKTVQNKLISFGVGRIKGFSDVRLNDNGILKITETRMMLSVKNTLDPNATVTIGVEPFSGFDPNKRTTWVTELNHDTTREIRIIHRNMTVQQLLDAINSHSGWVATSYYPNEKASDIPGLEVTACYNTAITLNKTVVTQAGLEGCSYTAYIGDGEQPIDSRVTGATQEDKAKLVGGLKYDAYLAITATSSEKVNGDYNVTTIVKGRIVKIYTSPTTYYEDWTDNPAWCVLDYMTSIDACGMSVNEADIYGVLNAAAYFDQIVNGKKRFTVNLILDEKKSHQDWINEILATCRGYRTYQRGMHGILVDKPEPVSQIFNVKPDEDIEIWWQDLEEDIERLQITYIDPQYEYSKVIAQADKTAVAGQQQFRNKMPLIKKIEIYGINNFEQASREAWFHLNKAQTCSEWIRYKTNKRALNRTIGDVVGIYDPITQVTEPGLAYKRYRIMSMTEPQGLSIEMVMQEYNPNLYNDTMGSVAPVINITKLANPTSSPPDVSDIQLAQVYYRQADGTIISYITGACALPNYGNFSEARLEYSVDDGTTWADAGKTNSDGAFIVDNVKTGLNYIVRIKVVNRMGIASDGAVSDPIYITGKDVPPSNVPSLTVTIDATDSTKIQLSWPAVTDIDLRGYKISEGSTILTHTPILDTRYTYTAASSRQYNFSVVAVDNSGNPSEIPAVKSIDITTEPAQVAGFSVTPLDNDRSRLRMQWTANTESDISYYEIRLGSNGWDTASIIATQLKSTVFETTLATAGSITYMIKAVNVAGKYSVNATNITKQYTLTPNAPASGSITQDSNDRTYLVITWLPITDKDLSQYEVRLGTNWDTATAITATKETTVRYKVTASGSYKVMVKAKNAAGYYSTALNLSIEASIEAMDVTGFAAVQSISDHSRVTLFWDPPSALDVAYFEIRKGTTWDVGAIIGKRVTGAYFDVIVTDETSQTFWIKAINIGGVYSQYPAKIEGIYNLNPSMPTNLVITQNSNDRSELIITWDGIPELDLFEYQLKVGYTWETGDYVAKTKELKATYKPTVSGDCKFMLKAKNNSDFYSDEVFEHFYAILEPSNVTNFQASQNGENVLLTWTKVADADVVAYEIREGSTFDNGSIIQTGVTMAMYQFPVDTEITRKFHVKAINRSGRYSQEEAMASVTISNLLPKNVISTYDEIALATGTHSNTEFGQSLFTYATLPGKFSDYPTTKFSDIGGASVLKLARHSLILNSNVPVSSNAYLIKAYTLSEDIIENQTYTMIIKGTIGANQKFGLWQNSGAIQKGVFAYDATRGVYSLTFVASPTTTGNERIVSIYNFPSTGTMGATIEWVQFERGSTSGSFASSGIYTCARKDMSSIITANIATIFQPSILFTSGTTATLQFRTSQDSTVWTEWTNFAPIQATFRYADFRVLLATTDITQTPEVNQFTIRVDVPDYSGRKLTTVAVGGTDIPYDHTYYQQVYPLPTSIGLGLKAELVSYTLSSAKVRIVNIGGTDVGGQAILDYTGY